MASCWIYANATVFTGLRCVAKVRRCATRKINPTNLQTTQRGRPAWLMAKDGEQDSTQGREGEQDRKDWDDSWSEFKQKQEEGGGIFKLPPEESQRKRRAIEDERTEKLTDAWSNDTGFLAGIGVIVLIGLFYGYVFATGGISH